MIWNLIGWELIKGIKEFIKEEGSEYERYFGYEVFFRINLCSMVIYVFRNCF